MFIIAIAGSIRELVLTQYPNFGELNMILKLLSLAVGAEVSWTEVLIAVSLAVVAWFALVLILSI